jgi:hypothetical protein
VNRQSGGIDGNLIRQKRGEHFARPAGTESLFYSAPALKCWATFTLSLRDGSLFSSMFPALKHRAILSLPPSSRRRFAGAPQIEERGDALLTTADRAGRRSSVPQHLLIPRLCAVVSVAPAEARGDAHRSEGAPLAAPGHDRGPCREPREKEKDPQLIATGLEILQSNPEGPKRSDLSLRRSGRLGSRRSRCRFVVMMMFLRGAASRSRRRGSRRRVSSLGNNA